MNLMLMILMVVLDLAAVVCNVRMLLTCFKDKTKYTFLQGGRTLAICQCACQVTIVVAHAIERWKGFASQVSEGCNIYRILSLSVMFFQACNLTAILTMYFERPVKRRNRSELSTKLTKVKVFAVLSLGFTGSVMICWYNCFSRQSFPQMALKAVFATTFIFVFVLFDVAAKNILNIEDRAEQNSAETSRWNFFGENQRTVFLVTLLMMCLVIILIGGPHSENNMAFMEALYLIYTTYIVGIVLPMVLSDLIDSSCEGKNEISKTVLI